MKFLGLMNFYCRFLPAAANTHLPLKEGLWGCPQPNTPLEWTENMQATFQTAKTALTSATWLAFPRR